MMKALVLAGGLGTRLRSSVPDLPKAMAPIAGRPFLEYILDQLSAGGVQEVILSVGYRAEAIKSHFGARYRDMVLDYSEEPSPLGTGGAVAYSLKNTGPDPCLVINGDTFLDIDFSRLLEWYYKKPAKVAIVLKQMPDVCRYGSIDIKDGSVTEFLEKGRSGPGRINAGVYILDPVVLKQFDFPGKFSLESDLLQTHVHELQPRAYITNAWFIDIGIPADFQRAQTELPRRINSGI